MAQRNDGSDLAVLKDWRLGVDESLQRIEEKIDRLDEKFAAKWVQTVVAGLVALILTAFIGALVVLVIPRPGANNATTSQTTTTTTPTGTSSVTTTKDTNGGNTK